MKMLIHGRRWLNLLRLLRLLGLLSGFNRLGNPFNHLRLVSSRRHSHPKIRHGSQGLPIMASDNPAGHNRGRGGCNGNRHHGGAGNHGNNRDHGNEDDINRGNVDRVPGTFKDMNEVPNNCVDKNRPLERGYEQDYSPSRNHLRVQLMHCVSNGEPEEVVVGCVEGLPSDIQLFLPISY